MAEKKSTVKKMTDAVQGAAAAVVKAADDHVVKPVGKALGLTHEEKPVAEPPAAEREPVRLTAAPVEAAPKPAAVKKSAAKLMTKPVAGKKSASAKTMSRRVADTSKTMKPTTKGGGSKGPRRGASKGR